MTYQPGDHVEVNWKTHRVHRRGERGVVIETMLPAHDLAMFTITVQFKDGLQYWFYESEISKLSLLDALAEVAANP